MREKFNQRTAMPKGVNLLLPAAAAQKRYLENELLRHFAAWGYQETVTPTFEFAAALNPQSDQDIGDLLYKFMDRTGKTLALRHEFTTPIARLAATHFQNAPLPLRFSYFGNVFRYAEPHAGRAREFYQAGIELLGVQNPLADAEIIVVLATALLELGITEFQINLGHAGFYLGMLGEYGLTALSAPERKAINLALHHKDAQELTRLLTRAGVGAAAARKITAVTELYGREEIIGAAQKLVGNPTSLQALAELAEITARLRALGVDKHIIIDLGEVKELDYYTGLIFEAFVPGLGAPLASGGRYDNLLQDFGFPTPAVGFALELGRLLLALENGGRPAAPAAVDYLIIDPENSALGLEVRTRLQNKGKKVTAELLPRGAAASLAYARHWGIPQIITLEAGLIFLTEVITETRRELPREMLERL